VLYKENESEMIIEEDEEETIDSFNELDSPNTNFCNKQKNYIKFYLIQLI